MALVSFARTTVQRVRAAKILDHGSEILDWSDVTVVDIEGCVVDTATGARSLDRRTADRASLVVLAPPGADIQPWDHIRVPGHDGDFALIDGPRRQVSPTGALDQVLLALERWAG